MNAENAEHGPAIGSWQSPAALGPSTEELLVSFDEERIVRILILPAMFDEANRMRRFTIDIMRRLDQAGIDSFLPDLPGTNESLAPLGQQTLAHWRHCAEVAADTFGATHVLAIRAGGLIAPVNLPGWQYSPQSGKKLMRTMIRARIVASREAGIEESSEDVLAAGRRDGLTLAGWLLGPTMIGELETLEANASAHQSIIDQSEIGGSGLWLRAEPDEDAAQADTLAHYIATECGGAG